MRKTVATVAAAGSLLAGLLQASVGAATPALAQSRPITLLCSPGSNGGTLVNGVCVLPAAAVGQPYEAFLLTSNGAVDTLRLPAAACRLACRCPRPTARPGPSSAAPRPRRAPSPLPCTSPGSAPARRAPTGPTASRSAPRRRWRSPSPPPAATPGQSARPTSRTSAPPAGSARSPGRFRRPSPARRGAHRRPPGRHPDNGRHVHVHHQGHRQRRDQASEPGSITISP